MRTTLLCSLILLQSASDSWAQCPTLATRVAAWGTFVRCIDNVAAKLYANSQWIGFEAEFNDCRRMHARTWNCATPRFASVNGGMIHDRLTDLFWEKKGANPGGQRTCSLPDPLCQGANANLHGNLYRIGSNDNPVLLGTAQSMFLPGLNASSHARFNDWRLPSMVELQSTRDPDAAKGAFAGLNGLDPSFPGPQATGPHYFWSRIFVDKTAVVPPILHHSAWYVDYVGGFGLNGRGGYYNMRAVRGGL